MKLSFFSGFTRLVDENGIRAAAKAAHEFGFDGVEFFFMAKATEEIPDAKATREYRAILDEYGLDAPCVSVGATLVAPEKEEKYLDLDIINKLKECVDFAHNIGARYLHHTLVMRLNKHSMAMDYDSTLPLLLEGAGEVADYAESLGVTVLYEPQGMLINGLDGFSEFYYKMKEKHPNVAVCGDVGNTYWADEEPYDFFDKFAEDMVHVHIKDYVKIDISELPEGEPTTLGGGALREVAIGTGEIDFARLVSTLRSVNYDGYFSIEDGTKADISTRVANFMSFAKRTFTI